MDVDSVSLHYVPEVTAGVTPASPAWRELRVTTPQISIGTETIESNEITGDLQVRDMIDVGQQVSGSLGLEASFRNWDDWLEATSGGTWAQKLNAAPTAVTTGQFTIGGAAPSWKAGFLVMASGFAQTANNGLFVASAPTANGIGVTGTMAEPTPPAGASVRLVGFQCATGDCTAGAVVSGRARLIITVASGSWLDLGLTVGEWVRVGGDAGANSFTVTAPQNNGWCRISGITSTILEFDLYPAGWAADTAGAKAIRILIGDRLTNGVVRRAFTVQRRFNSHSPVTYENSRGQEGSTLQIQLRPKSIVTATLGLLGRTGDRSNAQNAGSTNIAPFTGDVMATTDITQLTIDGVAHGSTDDSYMQNFTLGLDGRMRQRTSVNARGFVGTGRGKMRVGGQIEFYFGSKGIADKAIANVDVGLAGVMLDDTKAGYVWDIPAGRLQGDVDTPGTEQDAMFRGTFMGRKHPTLGYTIYFGRFWRSV